MACQAGFGDFDWINDKKCYFYLSYCKSCHKEAFHLSFEDIDKKSLPEDFQFLINSDNVVLSPHIAGWTHESHYKLAKVISEKVKATFDL